MRPRRPVGKPVGDLRPGIAAVGGLVNARESRGFDGRARAGRACSAPQSAAYPIFGLPGAKARSTAPVVSSFAEHLAPRFAAIGGFENAALRVLGIRAAKRGDHYDIGVARIDPQVADVLGVFEADVLPGLAGVGGFVHAVAHVDGAAHHADVAGADVDDVGLRWRDRHGADGGDRAHPVEDGRPDDASVDGLPNAAAGRSHVVDRGIAGDARHGGDAARAKRSDLTPAHGLVELGGERLSAEAKGSSEQRKGGIRPQ